MPMPPPPPLEGPVEALFLDVDGTIRGTFDQTAGRVVTAIRHFAETRAAARGEAPAAVEAQIWDELPRHDPRTWMHSNPASLGARLEVLKPRAGEDFTRADAALAHDLQVRRQAETVLFPDVLPVLERARRVGAKIFIVTDAPESRIAHDFYQMGLPVDWLAENHTRTEPPVPPPPHPLNDDYADFAAKLHAISRAHDKVKPNPAAVEDIIARHGLDRRRCLFVGDHAVDGLTAAGVGMPYAFQKQGAVVKPETAAFQTRLMGDAYPLGPEPQEARMKAVGMWPPSLVLEKGFTDLHRLRLVPAPPMPGAAPAAPGPAAASPSPTRPAA